jgi:hypothetical protein
VQFVDAATGLPIQGAITPKWTVAGPNLEYKTTHGNWTEFSSGTQITSELDGIIHFRGTGRTSLCGTSDRNPWIGTQPFIAKGRLANLLDWEHAETVVISNGGFCGMFGDNSNLLEAYFIYNPTDSTSNLKLGIVWGSNIRKFVGKDMNKVTIGTGTFSRHHYRLKEAIREYLPDGQ